MLVDILTLILFFALACIGAWLAFDWSGLSPVMFGVLLVVMIVFWLWLRKRNITGKSE